MSPRQDMLLRGVARMKLWNDEVKTVAMAVDVVDHMVSAAMGDPVST